MGEPALFWVIIGVMLLVLEFAVPGFVLSFFSVGALLTALLAWLMPSISIAAQLAIFIVVSLGGLFSLRGFLQKRFFTPAPKTDEQDDDKHRRV